MDKPNNQTRQIDKLWDTWHVSKCNLIIQNKDPYMIHEWIPNKLQSCLTPQV